MGLTERVQLGFYNENAIASTTSFVASLFPLLVPRGAIGRITRGDLIMQIRQSQGVAVDFSAFAAIIKGSGTPAGSPLDAGTIVALQAVMPVSMTQRAGSTPVETLVNTAPKASRNFQDEPHRTAEIRNVGRRTAQVNGWSIVHWSTESTGIPLSIWGQLEVEIEYIEDAKPTATMTRQRKFQLVNQ